MKTTKDYQALPKDLLFWTEHPNILNEFEFRLLTNEELLAIQKRRAEELYCFPQYGVDKILKRFKRYGCGSFEFSGLRAM